MVNLISEGEKWAIWHVGQNDYIKVGPTVEACYETIMLETTP